MSEVTCQHGQPQSCSLCGDTATSGVVISVDTHARCAIVETADRREAVALDLVDDVQIGEVVLVQHGFVIARLEQ